MRNNTWDSSGSCRNGTDDKLSINKGNKTLSTGDINVKVSDKQVGIIKNRTAVAKNKIDKKVQFASDNLITDSKCKNLKTDSKCEESSKIKDWKSSNLTNSDKILRSGPMKTFQMKSNEPKCDKLRGEMNSDRYDSDRVRTRRFAGGPSKRTVRAKSKLKRSRAKDRPTKESAKDDGKMKCSSSVKYKDFQVSTRKFSSRIMNQKNNGRRTASRSHRKFNDDTYSKVKKCESYADSAGGPAELRRHRTRLPSLRAELRVLKT